MSPPYLAISRQAVLDAGFLRALPALLKSPKMQLRKEVCWLGSP